MMMTKERMLFWISQWEDEARRAAERKDRGDWTRCCTQIWTMEFAMGFDNTASLHPQNRIPFPSYQPKGGPI